MLYTSFVLYATGLLLFLYKISISRRLRGVLYFLGFVVLGAVLFAYEHADMLSLVSGIVIFNMVVTSYGKKTNNLYIILGVFYVVVAYPLGVTTLSQSIFLGMLSGANISKTHKDRKLNKRIETRRDALQFIAGIFLIPAFYFLELNTSSFILLSLIVSGLFLGNYAVSNKRKKLLGIFSRFEREGENLGHGALWLSIGSLLAASLLNKVYIIIIFSGLYLGDSLSTVVGLNLKGPKLPYNRAKTVAGSLAYFIATSTVSYLFIGLYAIPVAMLAAFVEGLPELVDDNFDVAASLAFFFILISHFKIVF